MKQKQIVVVVGIIENSNGEILVSQRIDPKIKEAHLKWDFPGGKVEFGENLEDALKREIIEETGFNIEITNLLSHPVSKNWNHEEYFQHTLVFCYLCNLVGGKMHLEDHKINDLKWIKPKEVLKLDLLPTAREFVEKIV